jgi:type I restriction enzyme S subunit
MSESNLVQNIAELKKLPTTWIVKDFKNVVSDNSGGNKKLAKTDFLELGEIAIVDQGKELIAGFYNDLNFAVKTKPPYIVFGDHTRIFKYIDFPFVMGADGTKVLQPNDNNCNTKYLYYFFLSINVPETGYNRHFKYLKDLQIPLPPLETQQKIASILDAADTLRQKDKELLAKYDELTQALFLDMFGDPVSNPKGWEKVELKNFGSIKTGNTPSRNDESNYSTNHIEWLKTDNIKEDLLYVSSAKEYLSKSGLNNARFVEEGALLVACIAGSIKSIGRAALTDRKVSFNQQINAIQPSSTVNSLFLYHLFKSAISYIQEFASNGMKRMLTKGEFEKIQMIKPPYELQTQFAERVAIIEKQKAIAQASLEKSEELFNSLLQKAFKGELV